VHDLCATSCRWGCLLHAAVPSCGVLAIELLFQRAVLQAALTAFALLFVLPARSARQRRAIPALAAFAAISIADALLLTLPLVVPAIRPAGFDYNWGGKVLSLALGLACVYVLRVVTPSEAGLTWKQRPGSIRPASIAVGVVLLIELPLFWLLFSPAVPSLEDHLFQLSLPGLSEELMFRGVLLALIDRVAPPRLRVMGADLGWGTVATSVLFGAVHAVSLSSDWSLTVNWMAGFLPLLGGFVFVWLRARTGSLVWPIVLHNVANETANLVVWLKYLVAV
jgi:CAAX protease family protein